MGLGGRGVRGMSTSLTTLAKDILIVDFLILQKGFVSVVGLHIVRVVHAVDSRIHKAVLLYSPHSLPVDSGLIEGRLGCSNRTPPRLSMFPSVSGSASSSGRVGPAPPPVALKILFSHCFVFFFSSNIFTFLACRL